MKNYKELHKKDQQAKQIAITDPVPFAAREIKENITITNTTNSKTLREEIINYAFLYHSKGEVLKAIKYYQFFFDQGFNDHKMLSNYGVILKIIGDLKQAEIYQRKAIKLNPCYAEAHNNLGIVLGDLERTQEAEIAIRKAIQLKPNFAEAYSNLSLLELLNGNYESGLEHYEFRFKKNKPALPHCKVKLKRFKKKVIKKKEKLLIITEQGLGDTLQYMRYIPYLRKQGFDISFCAQEKLHSLIKASEIDPEPLTPKQANLLSDGHWMPLLSLAKYLKISPENPIIVEPYIFSSNELVQKWKQILSKEKRPIIGINWQGNPSAEKVSQQGRSLPLETFSTILRNNNLNFLSLQKGFGSEQLNNCSFREKFVNCQKEVEMIWDFLEISAIISNLDLVITSDTSVAHLAGGMGKPTWILLKALPDWRWGLDSDKTFWYPSMKVFRQKERKNWDEVLDRVSTELININLLNNSIMK